jgi:hypothetical protein
VSSTHNKILLLVEIRTMSRVCQTRRCNQNVHENEGVCLVTVDYIESESRAANISKITHVLQRTKLLATEKFTKSSKGA